MNIQNTVLQFPSPFDQKLNQNPLQPQAASASKAAPITTRTRRPTRSVEGSVTRDVSIPNSYTAPDAIAGCGTVPSNGASKAV